MKRYNDLRQRGCGARHDTWWVQGVSYAYLRKGDMRPQPKQKSKDKGIDFYLVNGQGHYFGQRSMVHYQGGDTPIYPVLRSSSSVKVLTYLIFALTLDQEYNFTLTFD